jgi:signal transduction histidine kinase
LALAAAPVFWRRSAPRTALIAGRWRWCDVGRHVLLLLAVVTGDTVRARRAFRESQRAREAERERQAHARQQVAEERVRIAQEVHDVVAHAMVAISVQAGTAAHVVDRRPGPG